MLHFLSLGLSFLLLGLMIALVVAMIRSRADEIGRALSGIAVQPVAARAPTARRTIRVRISPTAVQPLRAAA